jgi:serine/threonine protein kinase
MSEAQSFPVSNFLQGDYEYIPGLSVNQFINDDLVSTVPESWHFGIWSNISDAISYIHRKGILHNDINPANIIFGPDSRGAVLCDFGLATSSTEPSNGGTPNYSTGMSQRQNCNSSSNPSAALLSYHTESMNGAELDAIRL